MAWYKEPESVTAIGHLGRSQKEVSRVELHIVYIYIYMYVHT